MNWRSRKILKAAPKGRETLEINLSPRIIDPVFYFLLKFENFVNTKIVKIPFGTSFVVLLRKNDD